MAKLLLTPGWFNWPTSGFLGKHNYWQCTFVCVCQNRQVYDSTWKTASVFGIDVDRQRLRNMGAIRVNVRVGCRGLVIGLQGSLVFPQTLHTPISKTTPPGSCLHMHAESSFCSKGHISVMLFIPGSSSQELFMSIRFDRKLNGGASWRCGGWGLPAV